MKYSLALTVCLATASFAAVGQGPLDLLKDLHTTALDAAVHASHLKSLSRAVDPSWQTEGVQLGALKSDLNEMARILGRLEHFRGVAAPAEQKAIDQSIPLLQAMARNTQTAIQYLSEKEGNLWLPAYRKYIDSLEHESEQLSGSLGRFIKLAKVRGQEERLEKTLGVEAGR